MPVARDRSRLVKLILPIESMIGRASNLVMSICSIGVDSSSALRLSLMRSASCVLTRVSVVISCSNGRRPQLRAASFNEGMSFRAGGQPHPKARLSAELLQLHDVRSSRDFCPIEAGHRLVIDDHRVDNAEAVELGA